MVRVIATSRCMTRARKYRSANPNMSRGPGSNRSLLIPRPLVGSRAGENAEHTVVPFVAGVLEDRAGMAGHGNLYGPGAAVHGRIRDRCSIENRVSIGSGEAFGHAQVLIGHTGKVSNTKSALVVELEVRCFD